MPQAPQPPSVPNTPQVLPVNLRYTDSNGDLVTTVFPLDYITHAGQTLSNTITLFNSINITINLHSTEITALQVAVGTIPTPYITPQINGLCLNSNVVANIDTILLAQVTAWCAHLVATGSTAALASVLSFQCTGLNSSVSFATPGGQMAAITGWVASPQTVADSLKNMWLTICDLRAGMVTALAQSAPSCASAIIGYAGVYIPGRISLYFSGYTFIPSGFIDNGSVISVYDSAGNLYQTGINIITASNSAASFDINTSGTTLLTTSNYTIYLNSHLVNSTLGLTCQKTTIITVQNNSQICPNVVNVSSTNNSVGITWYPYILGASNSYEVGLYLSGSTTPIQTNTSSPLLAGQNTTSFGGLSSGTGYRLRIIVTIGTNAPVSCSFYDISTS